MSSTNSNKKTITWIAESGLLIALLIVVQLLTFAVPKSIPIVSQLFTGSLINLVLIVGAATVGFSGTAIAAILSPVLAFLFGQMTMPPMIPVVMIGNLVIVAVIWVFFHKDRTDLSTGAAVGLDLAGILVGAVAKTAFLWAATLCIAIPIFFNGKPKIAKNLSMMFSWPQLITAIIGGVIALLVLPAIRKYRSRQN